MEITKIKNNIEKILDDNKAQNITSIKLKNKSYIADYMIIASGTSSRHLQSLSEILITELKKSYTIIIVTHSMQQAARVSDKTAFFHLGNLIEEGDTSKIFTKPDNQKTNDYITGRFG